MKRVMIVMLTLLLGLGVAIEAQAGKLQNGRAYVFLNRNGAGGLGHVGGAFQFKDEKGKLKFLCFSTEKGALFSSNKGSWQEIVDNKEMDVINMFMSHGSYTDFKRLDVKNVNPDQAFAMLAKREKEWYMLVNRNCENDVYDVLHDEDSGYGVTAKDNGNNLYIGWVQSAATPNFWFDDHIRASDSSKTCSPLTDIRTSKTWQLEHTIIKNGRKISSGRMNYKTWDGGNWTAEIYGDQFVHRKEGSCDQHLDDHIDYVFKDGSKWRAKLNNGTFIHAPKGDFNKSHNDRFLGYVGWNGDAVSVSLM